jgi:hypothetical protein
MTVFFLAQETGGDVSTGDLTLGGLVASISVTSGLLMWIRQLIKDRDEAHKERRATQAKYDDLAQQAFPVLASAAPTLEKVTEALKQAHASDVDEFKQAVRAITTQLRSPGKER